MKSAAFEALCHDLQSHRVLTAEALRAAGATRSVIYEARRRGTLQDLPGVEGIYVLGVEPYDDVVRMHAAATLAGPEAIITGLWGARVHGLPWVPAGGACMVRIDAAHKRRGSEGFVSVCRTNTMERIETVDVHGLRIAAAAQCVIDAARQVQSDPATRRPLAPDLELRAVRGLVLGAIAQGRCTPEQLEAVLGQGSIRWTAKIRRALTDAARGAASPPEAELVDGLLPYGIPFYCNVEVWFWGRLIGVLDVLLVGTRVGGEMDSRQEHGDEDQLDATLLRDGTFKDVGFDLRHVTPTRYRRDPEAFHQLLIALAQAQVAAGLGLPDGIELRPRGPLLCGPSSDITPYRLSTAA
jgi:hypothetical protein